MDTKSYIEKDNIPISISIMTIDPIESLRKLHIANLLPNQRIHHKTHCLLYSLAVVDIVITIQVQQIWGIS
jgi:hypothetical protein